MDFLLQLRLAEPLWLLLALVPLLFLPVWRRRGDAVPERLRRFADAHLLARLMTGRFTGTPGRSAATLGIVWLLAALALGGAYLAQPATTTEEQTGIDIVAVVDISPSMLVSDVAPDRITRARLELTDFADRLGGGRIGLIAFSANAYTLLPLTHDVGVFREYVDLLETGLVYRQGSNLPLALEQAGDLLVRGGQPARAVVLITDGESHYPGAEQAARRLAADGIPLLILGVGTAVGGPIPANDGGFIKYDGVVVTSSLKTGELRALAQAGGGAYTDVRDDDGDWDTLFDALDGIGDRNRYVRALSSEGYALFPWLLAAALAIVLWNGVRRAEGLAVLLLVPLVTAPSPAQASPWQEQRAWEALQAGDCERAQELYAGIDTFNGRLGAGAAAYRCGDWQQALTAFQAAERLADSASEHARASYNIGNALVGLGRLDEAADRYEAALALEPGFQRAARNLTLLNRQRDAMRLGDGEKAGTSPTARPDRAADPVDERVGTDADLAGTGRQRTGQPDGNAAPRPGGAATAESVRELARSWQLESPAAGDTAELGTALQQLETLEGDKLEYLKQQFYLEDTAYGKILEEKPW